VAALVAFGCCDDLVWDLLWDLVWHGGTPSVLEVLKSSKERVYSWTSSRPG
jgi:hypothetical protein